MASVANGGEVGVSVQERCRVCAFKVPVLLPFSHLSHGHLGLLLLGLLGGHVGVDAVGVGHDVSLHVLVEAEHDSSGGGDAPHEHFEAHAPSVDAGGGGGAEHGDEADVLTGEDESDVRTHPEEGVVLLGLVDGGDGVGEPPEEEGDDDGTPHLGHEVKEGETPVPEDANGGGATGGEGGGKGVTEGVGVDGPGVGVKDEGKGGEEGQEGNDDGAVDVLLRHAVGHLGVKDGEGDSSGEVDVSFEEGDDLSCWGGAKR